MYSAERLSDILELEFFLRSTPENKGRMIENPNTIPLYVLAFNRETGDTHVQVYDEMTRSYIDVHTSTSSKR